MKTLLILILLLIFVHSFAQDIPEEKEGLNILIGVKTRVTPIYIKRIPDFIHIGNVDILEQPDKHFSGPGIHITERKKISKKLSLAFHQTIRYDYIYQRLPLVSPPPDGFDYKIKQKVIFDLYADVGQKIESKNSFFRLLVGLGICGLNSGHTETQRVYQSSTDYTDQTTKKDFIFPAAIAGFGWQKQRFYTELKIGYCWNNPTIFNTPFIFPEISCQYIFSSSRKKDKL